MKRGELWRSREAVAERGHRPGYYVIVSRGFIVENDDVSTVICAPVYGRVLGLETEVVVGLDEGLPHTSGVRCDFLMLLFQSKLTALVGSLKGERLAALDRALALALDLPTATR
jgi:mRNA interferase MazF